MAVPDEIRERVAATLWHEGAYCGLCSYEGGWDQCPDCKATLLGYADALFRDRDALLSMLGAEQAAWETAYGLYGMEADEATLRRRPRGDEITPLYRFTPSEER